MPSNRTIRTFCITGADGSGKTALVEAFLHLADPKHAAPDGSTARLDAEPEEKKRNFSLSLHPETFDEGGRTFNVLDTPGFAAFLTEVDWALRVSDGALLLLSAADGAHNHAERHFDVLSDSGVPALAVIGRMDHERADFAKALGDVETSLKVKPIPLQLPIGQGAGLKGLVDVLAMKAHVYDKGFARWNEKGVTDLSRSISAVDLEAEASPEIDTP